jgi:hypothetical protein
VQGAILMPLLPYTSVAASGPRPVRSLETRGFLLCKDYSFL